MKKIARQLKPLMESKGFEYHRGGFIKNFPNTVVNIKFELDKQTYLDWAAVLSIPIIEDSLGRKKSFILKKLTLFIIPLIVYGGKTTVNYSPKK